MYRMMTGDNIYQGTNAVMTPNTNIVTDAPQTATLRPNLSETSPEQNVPRAKPKNHLDFILVFMICKESNHQF